MEHKLAVLEWRRGAEFKALPGAELLVFVVQGGVCTVHQSMACGRPPNWCTTLEQLEVAESAGKQVFGVWAKAWRYERVEKLWFLRDLPKVVLTFEGGEQLVTHAELHLPDNRLYGFEREEPTLQAVVPVDTWAWIAKPGILLLVAHSTTLWLVHYPHTGGV